MEVENDPASPHTHSELCWIVRTRRALPGYRMTDPQAPPVTGACLGHRCDLAALTNPTLFNPDSYTFSRRGFVASPYQAGMAACLNVYGCMDNITCSLSLQDKEQFFTMSLQLLKAGHLPLTCCALGSQPPGSWWLHPPHPCGHRQLLQAPLLSSCAVPRLAQAHPVLSQCVSFL